MRDIKLLRVTVRNCTLSGVSIEGVDGASIESCDLSGNGGDVSPGTGQHHNLFIGHCSQVTVIGSRLADSMLGSGVSAVSASRLVLRDCEITRNRLAGLKFSECEEVSVRDSLLEGNSGMDFEWLRDGRPVRLEILRRCISRCNGADASFDEGTNPCRTGDPATSLRQSSRTKHNSQG